MRTIRSILPLIFLAFVIGSLPFLTALGSGPGNRDEPDNDSFENAEDIQVQTEPIPGTLRSDDVADYYRLADLTGDNLHDQVGSQRISISLKKDQGADVMGTLYDPNRIEFGTLLSTGDQSQVEFVVPFDGDYYLKVTSNPPGQSSDYSVRLGGVLEYDNSGAYDKDNRFGDVGYSTSKKVSGSIDPVRDVFDVLHVDIPGKRSLEAEFETDYPMRIQFYNGTYAELEDRGPNSVTVITNNEDETTRVYLRIHNPLVGGEAYGIPRKYILYLTVWSHTTTPQVYPADSWDAPISFNEDARTEDIPVLNLSKHFYEPNDDPFLLALAGEVEHVEVEIVNYTDIDRLLYVEAHFSVPDDWYGTETLTFTATDRDGSVSDSIDIEVISVNDPPVITKIGLADHEGDDFYMGVDEDATAVYEIEYHDIDDPLSSLYFTTNETLPFMEINSGNGTIVVSPAQSDVGVYLFYFNLHDPNGGVHPVNISLTVEPVNDPPLPPSIEVLSGNVSSLLPGEPLSLKAIVTEDPDGDELVIEWDMGDGTRRYGDSVDYSYGEAKWGNRTVTLTVSDGEYSASGTLQVYVERPEDIAVGDLRIDINDPKDDVVRFHEEWRTSHPGDRTFDVRTTPFSGIDILSLGCVRRENSIEVRLKVSGAVVDDGRYGYHIYILDPAYEEKDTDMKNTSGWDAIPGRLPVNTTVFSSRAYLGLLDNRSTGRISGEDTLVFVVSFKELTDNGLEYPISTGDFSLFAVVTHTLPYDEKSGLVERYVASDTAGNGALVVGELVPDTTSGGSGGSTFGDFDRKANWAVVIGMVLAILVLGGVGVFFLLRLRNEKRRKDREFDEYLESMKKEGKDLFGKKDEERTEEVSYEKLYGSAPPKDYKDNRGPVRSNLPKPGLGRDVDGEGHVMESVPSGKTGE